MSGADDIAFEQSILPAEINLSSGELTVSSDVTILGPGTDQLEVDGAEATRVFHVTAGTSIFDGIHIFNGLVTLPAAAGPRAARAWRSTSERR